MHPGPGWIHRDELMRWLEQRGLRVSNHQLLRWHYEGLLPQPRRIGRGRGRGGSDSYYPWWAALQAEELAGQLDKKRNLDDAGWVLWVAGFPVTTFARELLLDDLEAAKEDLTHALEARPGAHSILETAAYTKATDRMREAVRTERVPRVLRMLGEMQLGTLDPNQYVDQDWQLFQEAGIAEAFPDSPDVPDDEDLPSPSEVAAGIAELSARQNVPAVIKALEGIGDRWLCIYRNEAQTLFEMIAEGTGVIMSRDGFLRYFSQRHVDRESAKGVEEYLRALGWTKPPLSRFHQLIIQLRQREAKGAKS